MSIPVLCNRKGSVLRNSLISTRTYAKHKDNQIYHSPAEVILCAVHSWPLPSFPLPSCCWQQAPERQRKTDLDGAKSNRQLSHPGPQAPPCAIEKHPMKFSYSRCTTKHTALSLMSWWKASFSFRREVRYFYKKWTSNDYRMYISMYLLILHSVGFKSQCP